uniref:exo-alpha-sialidase n=1 Tax=Laticauda laticaudata TaxID=8630 RepID=A0A8C5RYX3_LATLA
MSLWDPARPPAPRGCGDSFLADFGEEKERLWLLLLFSLHEAKGLSPPPKKKTELQTVSSGLPNHRTMNPCPVYDKKNDIIFLFFICVRDGISEQHQIRMRRNAVRLGYISSEDGSRNWSSMTDLTEQVMGDDEAQKWATFAVGPGHGVQLNSGRLVIPAYAYYIHKSWFGYSFPWWIKPHCFSFYSDDGGQTWARSELLKALKTTECQMAEVTCKDNRQVLYCNARSLHKFRAEAYSADNGCHFPDHALCKQLCELPLGCQGSITDASPSSASPGCPKSWLMFSHPTRIPKQAASFSSSSEVQGPPTSVDFIGYIQLVNNERPVVRILLNDLQLGAEFAFWLQVVFDHSEL